MKVHAKKGEVILQDLSKALHFVFCNTKKLTAREKHLARVTDLLVGTWCSMLWKIPMEHMIVNDLCHMWVAISTPPVSFFLMKQRLLYLFWESRKKAKCLHGFQTFISYTFFHCLYIILCLKRKQRKQCEYGFKGAWELPTLKYGWLEKKHMRYLRFLHVL